MSVIVKNLTSQKLAVPSPVNKILRQGQELSLEFVEYDAVLNTPGTGRMVKKGLLGVQDTDPIPPASSDSLQGAYDNSPVGNRTIELAGGAGNGVNVYDASVPIGSSLFRVGSNAGTALFLDASVSTVDLGDINGATNGTWMRVDDANTNFVFNTGEVGIWTTNPQVPLHVVRNGVAGTPALSGRTVAAFQNTTTGDDARVAIVSDNANIAALDLGDVDAQIRGSVQYSNSTEEMILQTSGAPRLRLRTGIAEVVGGLALPTSSTASNLIITDTDGILSVFGTGGAGGIQVTLPAAASNAGRVVVVKKVDAGVGAVTLAASGADSIDGIATRPLAIQYAVLMVQSDGASNWFLL